MRITEVTKGDLVQSGPEEKPEKIKEIFGVDKDGLVDPTWGVITESGIRLTAHQCYSFTKAPSKASDKK